MSCKNSVWPCLAVVPPCLCPRPVLWINGQIGNLPKLLGLDCLATAGGFSSLLSTVYSIYTAHDSPRFLKFFESWTLLIPLHPSLQGSLQALLDGILADWEATGAWYSMEYHVWWFLLTCKTGSPRVQLHGSLCFGKALMTLNSMQVYRCPGANQRMQCRPGCPPKDSAWETRTKAGNLMLQLRAELRYPQLGAVFGNLDGLLALKRTHCRSFGVWCSRWIWHSHPHMPRIANLVPKVRPPTQYSSPGRCWQKAFKVNLDPFTSSIALVFLICIVSISIYSSISVSSLWTARLQKCRNWNTQHGGITTSIASRHPLPPPGQCPGWRGSRPRSLGTLPATGFTANWLLQHFELTAWSPSAHFELDYSQQRVEWWE